MKDEELFVTRDEEERMVSIRRGERRLLDHRLDIRGDRRGKWLEKFSVERCGLITRLVEHKWMPFNTPIIIKNKCSKVKQREVRNVSDLTDFV